MVTLSGALGFYFTALQRDRGRLEERVVLYDGVLFCLDIVDAAPIAGAAAFYGTFTLITVAWACARMSLALGFPLCKRLLADCVSWKP